MRDSRARFPLTPTLSHKGRGGFKAFFVVLFLSSFTASAMDFSAHGYYRNRFEAYENLDLQKSRRAGTDNNRFNLIQYNQMRLRVEPVLKINDNLSIQTQLDFLDNLVYGSSDVKRYQLLSPLVGTQTLPAGNGAIGMVGGTAGENGSVNVRHAWMDVLTPIGKFRLGRQPSHWGLGIFQNDGRSFQGDFGDTYDRVLFLTQKEIGGNGAINVGALWDIAFESQFDPSIQGLGGQVRNNGQDNHQWAILLLYENPNLEIGTFSGIRKRDGSGGTTMTATPASSANGCTDANANGLCDSAVAAGIDGDTLMFFGDVYARYHHEEYTFGLEGVYMGGKITTGLAINALPFSAGLPNNATSGIIQLPAKQDIAVLMAALEGNARYKWGGEIDLKAGYASGDDSPLSTKIIQFGFRPDYKVGLLMFDQPLGTSPTLVDAGTGRTLTGGVPITGNFINNAIYVAAGYKHHFDVRDDFAKANDVSVGGRVLTAWAPKKNINLNFNQLISGGANLPTVTDSADSLMNRWYGFEIDLLLEGRFFDHLVTTLEAGVLLPRRGYDIDVKPTSLGNLVNPITIDQANFTYGGRLTVAVEF